MYVKTVVLCSRPNLMSSCNLYLVFGPLNQLYISEHVCEQWFLFLIISGCILMATLDFLLMLRGTIHSVQHDI